MKLIMKNKNSIRANKNKKANKVITDKIIQPEFKEISSLEENKKTGWWSE